MPFVSDIISNQQIASWNGNDRILIKASCGTGKTRFVYNQLCNFVEEHQKQILYLGNRTCLLQQIQKHIEGKNDIVQAKTYQSIEHLINNTYPENERQNALIGMMESYDYIVADEAHYFFADSELEQSNTYLWLPAIESANVVIIFMTATPQILQTWIRFEEEKIFNIFIPPQFNQKFFYTNDQTMQKVMNALPPEEKVIYFSQNIDLLVDLHKHYNTRSLLVCSQSNKQYKYVDQEKVSQMLKNESFDTQFLLTTSVLDNGITFKDRSIKHIICDYPDIITVIQCLGRKRFIDEEDEVKIYIKTFSESFIQFLLGSKAMDIQQVTDYDSLSKEQYAQKYKTKYFNKTLHLHYDHEKDCLDFVINAAVVYKLQYDLKMLQNIHHYTDFVKLFCQESSQGFASFTNLENTLYKIVMESLFQDCLDVRLYTPQQNELKQNLKNCIPYLKKHNGKKAINNYLEGVNSKYRITSGQEKNRKTGRRDETYWKIIPVG